WIVIQQRIDGSQSFNQTWSTYKSGFGIYYRNFWLGLEKMHQLTASADYRLRFEVLDKGKWYSDEYDHFKINSELEKYSINVSGYRGDWFDGLNYPKSNLVQNGMNFSTPDQDNDRTATNCASYYSSGNWFNGCFHQNVNGAYGPYGSGKFIYAGYYPTYSRMMMKRNV
ncbi:hypothetical protein HELRODRAFT_92352, partial [Helobdella robusta]|uniref:Fibrinogen C-terminal domain-containing protein n=1 Tax=Helobdella robusta TaxID=6412 RepID=T1G8E8_HELRO